MEVLIGLAIIAGVILTLKWIGSWLIGVTNVLEKQDKALNGMKKMNENLLAILEELKKEK